MGEREDCLFAWGGGESGYFGKADITARVVRSQGDGCDW